MLRMPELQRNGQFVGHTAYQQFLRMQRPPMTEAEFEGQLRNMLIGEKLHAALTGWMTVPDAEVEAEYRKRNEKVKLDLAVFKADQFRTGITPTDAELEAQFKANPETYRVPEKRRVKFLLVDAETPDGRTARWQRDVPGVARARSGR